MKAIQIQSHGDLEVLRVKALPDPDPGVDELLVRIKASAVNPLDGIIRTGEFPIAKEPPLILGEEAAGVIERNGGGFRAGDRVIVYGGGWGVFRDGTWAELVAAPASSLRRLPDAGRSRSDRRSRLRRRPDREGYRGARHSSRIHCG